MSLNTILHLTIRIDVPGSTQSQADLALPNQASFAEILGEVLALLKAPTLSTPWQPTTVAGTPLSPTAPLAALPLTHGDIVILRPHQDTPPPMVVDVGEALVDAPLPGQATELNVATICVGVLGATWWAWRNAPSPWLVLACIALAAIIMLTITTRQELASTATRLALATTTPVPAGLAAWTYVAAGEHTRETTLIGGLSATATVVVAAVAIQVVSYAPATITTIWLTLALIAGSSLGVLALVPHQLVVIGPAAACVGITLLLLMFVPAIAVQLAGLKVPRLPSAGQDFSVTDAAADPEKAQAAASLAIQLHDGLIIALSIAGTLGILGACAFCTDETRPYCAALSVAIAAAIGLHAIRHRSPWSTWSLWLWTLASVIASIFTVPIIGLLLVILCFSSILWAHYIPNWQPTTICWLERFEAFAIAVSLPLSAHIAGLFLALRGLG